MVEEKIRICRNREAIKIGCRMTFTVFTPSYNRGALLPRVYDSLKRQSNKDFEWLIIDDGSTDNTEDVVKSFLDEKEFAVRYIKKTNGGKHTAHNLAVEKAECEWFICLDSDDIFTDNAVEYLNSALSGIADTDCGIVGNKMTLDGACLSEKINVSDTHMGLYGYCRSCGGGGEYALAFKTEVLKKYLFPEIKGERFVTECVLYDRLELDGYTFAVVDKTIELCEYQSDGLTCNIYRVLKNNPTGYAIYHMQRIDLVDNNIDRFLHGIKYWSFRFLGQTEKIKYRGKHKLLVFLTVLPGLAGMLYYKFK